MMTADDNAAKKAARQAKQDFDLHVALIMRDKGVIASKARFMAWLEGPPGLQGRLNRLHTEPDMFDNNKKGGA